MVVLIAFNDKSLVVKQLPVLPNELLVAFPEPTTLRQTRLLGPEQIASHRILFPCHKVKTSRQGRRCLSHSKQEETWFFCLQIHEFPTLWDSNVASIGVPQREVVPTVGLRANQTIIGSKSIQVLNIQAGKNEVQLTIPEDCQTQEFQITELVKQELDSFQVGTYQRIDCNDYTLI
jgi:hypothetical protein